MPAISASRVGEVAIVMPHTLQNAKFEASKNLCRLREALDGQSSHNANMPRKRALRDDVNHLRAWREFRNLTQEELAEKVGTTGPVISLIESGKRGLSLKWLLKLAPALETTPGFLLDHDPNDLPADILEIWGSATEREKRQIVDIAKALIKTGTNG